MMNLVYDIHSMFQLGFFDMTMKGTHFRLALNQELVDIQCWKHYSCH